MGFLNLNLYEHPSGAEFDPESVIRKVKSFFPEATFLPGDQLAAEVKFAEDFFAKELQADPESTARYVIGSLRRKAKLYGPAYAFRIPLVGGREIKGLARRVNVQFLFEEPLPEGMRERLIEFLKSFGVGRLESSTNDERQSEVLCDMMGDAELREQPAHP